MNSLDLFSVRALEEIHSTKKLSDLPQVVFSTLKSLVPGAMTTFDQLDFKTGKATTKISEDSLVSADVKARVLELMPQHPVVPAERQSCTIDEGKRFCSKTWSGFGIE